jgi:hypothetical protein
MGADMRRATVEREAAYIPALPYEVLMGASALVLLGFAVTGFATRSVADRILSGLGALVCGVLVWHVLRGGVYAYFVGFAVLFPAYGGYRLYRGFRRRHVDRVERDAAKAAVKQADDWRAQQRF